MYHFFAEHENIHDSYIDIVGSDVNHIKNVLRFKEGDKLLTVSYTHLGFTAKLAGTERGITEPTPTFSACFGQAFLELHPTKYAAELVKKMEKSGAKAYLVNTGWNGTGKRISIKDTRGIIDAILSGAINTAPTKKIPMFNFEVPTAVSYTHLDVYKRQE